MSEKPRIIYATKNDADYALVQCPACGFKAWIDSEQFRGEVSMICECGWHETHDLREK